MINASHLSIAFQIEPELSSSMLLVIMMMVSVALLFLLSSPLTCWAFQPTTGMVWNTARIGAVATSTKDAVGTRSRRRSMWTSATTASLVLLQSSLSPTATMAITDKPERVIPETLPVIYVYDHCPFCVRVRMALGLKNVKHALHFMANDDITTPTGLVGKKIAPIMQWDSLVMAESLDIVQHLDQDPRLGPTHSIAPFTGRQDLKIWQNEVQNLLRNLQRPRYVATGLLPEFQQLDGRHAYIRNHALPPYSSEEWKALSLTEQVRKYEECLSRPQHQIKAEIDELNRQLVVLNNLIHSTQHCSEGGISYDDIDLFARLRSITIIKGVEWPENLRSYMNYFSERADIPLYDQMAL